MSFSALSAKYQSWEKETSAFTLQLPSALQVSASELFFQYDLVIFGIEEGEVPEYTLEDLLEQAPGTNHREVYSAIKQWVAPSLCHGESIVIDIAVTDTKCTPPLDTSTNKRSGVQIVTNNNHLLVQVEVDLGNKKEATLTLGLLDQLRWLRNHQTTISSCSGFYFMNKSSGHVIHVVLEWVDDLWRFVQTLHRLPKECVKANIEQALTAAREILRSLLAMDQPPTNHVVPLSSHFLQGS